MVEASGSWLHQQRSPWVSSAFESCMIAPTEHRQHEFLPASVNPLTVSANLNLNGFKSSGLPERGLLHEAYGLIGKSVTPSHTRLCAPNEYPGEQTCLFPGKVDTLASTSGTPSPQQKRFVIFDQSGNETRLIFSSQCPWMQNLTTAQASYPLWNHQQTAPVTPFAAHQFHAGQPNTTGHACIKAPILYEESGENETVEEGSEMHEDTEDINALLYSDEDEGKDDEEASTGHSPSIEQEEEDEYDFDEVASIDKYSKRQKGLDGGCNKEPLLCTTTLGKQNASYENVHGGDLVCALDEGVDPTIGDKRPRKDKIRDTLKVLESIIPGLKSKDPLVILDEAISYLRSLKANTESIPTEDPDDTSGCYGPPN